MTAIPWSAMVPETRTTSPACDPVGAEAAAGRDQPDAGGRDVEAVGGAPVDHLGVAGDDVRRRPPPAAAAMSATIARSSATAKPSSRTKAADSARGRAPITARSLTVPCTARWPIEPPGKRSGLTTNESVLKASRSPDGRVRQAPSASGAEGVVGERVDEHGVDQGGRRLAAGAVGQGDDLVGEARAAAAERLDPVEHRRLPVADGRPAGVLTVARPRPERAWTRDHRSNAERGLGLLDAVDAVGPHDQAVVEVGARRHPAAVVAGQADGAAGPAGAPRRRRARRLAELPLVDRPRAMSPGAAVGDQLAGEHQLEADVVAQRGQHGLVGGEGAGRQGAAPGRLGEERGQAGGVGGAAAIR